VRFEHTTYVNQTDLAKAFLVHGCGITNQIIVRNNSFVSNCAMALSSEWVYSNKVFRMTNGANLGVALGPGDKMADPMLVNMAAKDSRLQAGSPPSKPALRSGV